MLFPKDSDYVRDGKLRLPQHIEQFRASGIPPEVVIARGGESITEPRRLAELDYNSAQQKLVPNYYFPGFNPLGEPAGGQIRPDKPRTLYGKVAKYESAAGSRNYIDVHPFFSAKRERDGAPYPSRVQDPTEPKFLTEGIKKVDSLAGIGLCGLGITGVSSYKGRNQAGGRVVLDDLIYIAVKGSTLYLTFDNDQMTKEQVNFELGRIVTFLRNRECLVKIVYLPLFPDGNKCGIDDFIADLRRKGRTSEQIRSAIFALAADDLRPFQGSSDDGSGKERIYIVGGKLPEIVDEVERIATEKRETFGLYRRGELTMHLSKPNKQDQELVSRSEDAPVLHVPSEALIMDIATRNIKFLQVGKKETFPVDCPAKVAQTLIARGLGSGLPRLTGIIEAPIMLRDGRVLYAPGYDVASGLLLRSDVSWLPVSDQPTAAEVEDAGRTLLTPWREFLYTSAPGLSVAPTAVMTGLQRRQLDAAPGVGLDGSETESGKTLQARCIGLILTGRKPSAISFAWREEEMEKKLFSSLLAGDSVVLIDNVKQGYALDGQFLASVLTEETVESRVLGLSRNARVPTNILLLVTGVNLQFTGDMPSRFIANRIVPGVERPGELVFAVPDLPGKVLENRARIVHAALTILRGYYVAGRPKQAIAPSRYRQWSDEIRSAVVWCGLSDPVETREEITVSDSRFEDRSALLATWRAAELPPMSSEELVKEVPEDSELYTALLKVAAGKRDRDKVDAKALGYYLRANKDRVANGLVLKRSAEGKAAGGRTRWFVAEIKAAKPEDKDDVQKTLERFGVAHPSANGAIPPQSPSPPTPTPPPQTPPREPPRPSADFFKRTPKVIERLDAASIAEVEEFIVEENAKYRPPKIDAFFENKAWKEEPPDGK
ncbi:MAG: DUF3854 domain-containing protein [Candidatus Binataceae bacterium]